MAELVVELAQCLQGVGPLQAGVVRDLVVAGERGVDRGAAAHHVGEDAGDDQVADEDAERATHQRVDPAAVAARLHVTANRTKRGRPFQDHLPAEQHQGAGGVVAVGEEGAVAGVRLLLRLHPADGEDHLVRLAGEEVAAAGAAVDEQTDPGAEPPLELGAVRRRRAGHHRRRLLLHPAERGDVLVRPQQDPRLARPRLRGEIRLPLDKTVRLPCPTGHVRRIAVPQRPPQHRQREPVDLQIDDPGHVGRGDDPLPTRNPVRDPDRGHVMGAEQHRKHQAHSRHHQRRKQRPAEVVDREDPVGERVGCQEDRGVRDQHQQEAEDQRQGQPQRRQNRRDDGVQRRNDHGHQQRAPEALDVDPRKHPGGHHQRDTRGEPRDDEWEQPDARALGLPGGGLTVCPLGFARHRALLLVGRRRNHPPLRDCGGEGTGRRPTSRTLFPLGRRAGIGDRGAARRLASAAMRRAVLFAVDGDAAGLRAVERELLERYARDYDVVCLASGQVATSTSSAARTPPARQRSISRTTHAA